ncbi:unknown protein [Seminavis robusta]|uniref:Uncharacterized protein n=1 Tax=Seminavis robusta TaxID=568900 RepID=A0A9N8EUL9_9STRA|nr:unknown protein [Seminavis robusta]|eukprot:Sro1736_g294361.1  (732) ;mRNA; r:399-2594
MLIHFVSDPPSYWTYQQPDKDEKTKRLVESKLQKVLRRRYFDKDQDVLSLMSYFHVPKGKDDIRMVYDATKCQLNKAIIIPGFPMPTIDTHLRAVEVGTHMCDVDIGEMFLNFMMHPSLRPYCGVDLTPYDLDLSEVGPQPSSKHVVVSWNRIAMGLTWSPYQAVLSMHFAEEVMRGDRTDKSNVFTWDKVRLNLPGMASYTPHLPWVSKVRGDKDKVAADVFTFVDDLRPCGADAKESWSAGRKAASTINWLGCQDAPRKRRDSRPDPGAWAGCVLRTLKGVFTLVSDEKWEKLKWHLSNTEAMIVADPDRLESSELQRVRGFLNYVAQTYKALVPFITGFHLTIDGWRPNRDLRGWRLTSKQAPIAEKDYPAAPKFVKAKPRLISDVKCLIVLCSSPKPPHRRVRPLRTAVVFYGFGDASGSAFAGTIAQQGSLQVDFEFGQWTEKDVEETSSNWKELTNLVEFIEERARSGSIRDAELFMFTDNSTAEAAYWKGSSKSQLLLDLVLRLRMVELHFGLLLHVVHVSGKRMIAQGTDGLSRGSHGTGVMRGVDMISFVPLHQTCIERSPAFGEWFWDVVSGAKPTLLTPENWFENVLGHGAHVWFPPPAAADVVSERLRIARHKRPNSLHIVVVPRLMTGRWRKQLGKAADVYFRLEHDAWWPIKSQFEPLLMFVCLPYLVHRPRFEPRQGLVERFVRVLCRDNLPQADEQVQRALLRKLFGEARALCAL